MTLPETRAADELVALAALLQRRGYQFTTVTPATHGRVLSRAAPPGAPSLRDVFGWNKPFTADQIDAAILEQMGKAGVLREEAGLLRSTVRASTIGQQLYFHSAYPTGDADSVFLGPDTYRFVRAAGQVLDQLAAGAGGVRRAADIGCGAGPGAIMLAKRFPAAEIHAVDINGRALALAGVNCRLAGVTNVACVHSDMLSALDGEFDLIISNPPYLLDPGQRAYRHGGGELGAGLSLRIVEAAIARLAPGGTLLLYTGVAIDNGEDPFLRQAGIMLEAARLSWKYEEIDPDVFGEELDTPAYGGVDRIAAVMLLARKGGAR
ncbi:Methyltransferase small domain-containing protein [Duganella sp. CF517]|uniref:class I SAM-dependent methyltransferase n=1 Tax=Duganella sp. CF517 TaxID=1881038 RepID=UPI0008D18DA3|nr:class I SAM-dependent methyltransferase [Duganella sp. CF517]SEO04920.1 Methyltransferase small domain-containing protein [Duganella sp. CF517]